jgi:hypothetical protein
LLRAQPAPTIGYREYARCLPDYLSALAAEAYARRNARIAQLKTPAAVRNYQGWARRTFEQLAGGLPERTPLNLRATAECPLANFVPGILRGTDLPQIARSVAPRPVIVAGAVDASVRTATRAQASYPDYREEPAWDFETLSQL